MKSVENRTNYVFEYAVERFLEVENNRKLFPLDQELLKSLMLIHKYRIDLSSGH